jgi:hypothetical protein
MHLPAGFEPPIRRARGDPPPRWLDFQTQHLRIAREAGLKRAWHLHLLRMPQQGEQPVAQQIGRRFMTGQKEQHQIGQQVVVAERRVVVLAFDQHIEQRVAPVRPPASQLGAQVLGHFDRGAVAVFAQSARSDRFDHHRDRVRPRLGLIEVAGLDTEHVADHAHRQDLSELPRNRKVRCGQAVQQRVAGGLWHRSRLLRRRTRHSSAFAYESAHR